MYTDVSTKPSTVYIPIESDNYLSSFCNQLQPYLETLLPLHNHELVIVCIGTDRATGDSLGPLVGYKLHPLNYENVSFYGNLDEPVHAKNLEDTLKLIQEKHPKALVIAIDACLGAPHNIGCVTIGEGAIYPGAGVKKNLPPIGHLHITGIVNFSSMMNMVVLQNTRLSLVMKMADNIAMGIKHCLWRYYKKYS
ncbi:spore protease YyaC [Sporanaerobium hydrogeniformans]|uniref:Spore protease YyaC n=1 Tax=Sporanaerobium hydrogeniformans TaxID=3072179 RepID=A0AC61D6E0_9FIRM|nr:spore protease YyaC [Sporanaerobium hydrogeniformans]PHV69279.1 spore protease YyaC [Sporanaerobium hydrogeniformans]